jgi:tetratricopeptide (TPR) repeat protein
MAKKKPDKPAPPPPTPHPAASARTRARPIWIVGAALVAIVALIMVVMPRDPHLSPVPAGGSAAQAQYAGGQACAACHDTEHAAWRGSDHDLAMQVANDASVLGDFNGAKFTYAGITSTFSRKDGKFIVNTDGPDGALHDYEIGYTFGAHPLQQYLIDFPGGRKQALSIAWDSRPAASGGQRWFHLYPNDNVKAGEWLHWTNYSQNWNFTCAECHSTDLKKNYDPGSNTYKTTWAEINVACEACHGPGSNHVVWARKEGDWKSFDAGKGLAVALDERKGVVWTPVADTGNAHRSAPRETTRELDTCARCHARASRLTDDYVHGKPPLDTHRLANLDDDLYWNDGQMRGEVYNWGSFVQSKMYAQGVTCSDCHDPHSLKLKAPGNAVCAPCHQPAKYDTAAHTHHAQGSAGAACAACHMPTTTYMVIDPRHDHSLRIPRPDLSAQLGTPNACNNCHDEQDAKWAAAAIAGWTGKPPASFQNFADALHAGSVGAPGARAALVAVVDDGAQPPIVRASAIERLGRWLTPDTTATVVRALHDPDPGVRLAAVEALGNASADTRQRELSPLLDDPVRAIRIEAARMLAGPGELALKSTQRPSFDKAIAEYVAVQTYNTDRPEGHMNLGNLAVQRGDANAAIARYQQAIALDPLFVAAYTNLADVYRVLGKEVDAQITLRQALKADPRSAVLHHTLGLALTRQKAREQSLQEFKTAAELAPNDARFAYVYAVALNDAGQRTQALRVIETALKSNPYDRNLLLGIVYFAQDRESARRAVALLRALEPDNAQFQQLEQQVNAAAAP